MEFEMDTDCAVKASYPQLEDYIFCAKLWNIMPPEDKDRYRNMKCYSDPDVSDMDVTEEYECNDCDDFSTLGTNNMRTHNKCQKSKGVQRKPKNPLKCGRTAAKRKTWVNPGPVTKNAYLNFLRTVRRRYYGLNPKQLVILGAYEWRCLSDDKKLKYRLQALEVSTDERYNQYVGHYDCLG